MTAFDFVAGAILLVSGLVGLARGATREVTMVIALVLAALIAVFGLRFTAPIAHHFIATVWMANVAAILVLFIIAYVILRAIGGVLTRGVRATALSGADRALGFAIGLVRGLVVLGAFVLFIHAATPPERVPAWLKDARLYPLADAAGDALRSVAPRGFRLAKDMAPTVADAVVEPSTQQNAPGDPPRHGHPRGYTAAQRNALDVQVEKSR